MQDKQKYVSHNHAAKALFMASALIASFLFPGIACAEDEPEATPYRPTVANPAELSVPGWLELEAGWIAEHGDGSRRKAVPYTAKLAFDKDWGVLLGGELWAQEDSGSGFGDTSLLLKHRIATGDKDQNFGFEAGFNLPTAVKGLGSGKTDWVLNGIYSLDFADSWRLDANVGAVRLGAPDAGTGRITWPWAASLSTNRGPWTFAGEISGAHQAGTAESVQYLAAVSYAVTPRLVVDGGVSSMHQGGQESHAVFFGATWLAGRIFK